MMDDFLKMDIFFGVATTATIVMTALLCIILIYLIRILRTVDRLSAEMADEAKALRADIASARASAKKSGSELLSFVRALIRYGKRLLAGKKDSR